MGHFQPSPPNYSPDIIDAKMQPDTKSPYAETANLTSSSKTASEIESQEDDKHAKLKAVQRRIDIKLLLWYSFVYLVLSIHKTNIANTAIINVEEGTDIITQLGGLSSGQWAWALRYDGSSPLLSGLFALRPHSSLKRGGGLRVEGQGISKSPADARS